MLKALGFAPLLLLLLGFTQRRIPRRHVPLMVLAMTSDLALVALIQTRLHVVEKTAAGLSTFQTFHVCIAIGTLVGYAAMVVTGIRTWRYGVPAKGLHRRLGLTVLALRSLLTATSMIVRGR